jgi:hypothetical protein
MKGKLAKKLLLTIFFLALSTFWVNSLVTAASTDLSYGVLVSASIDATGESDSYRFSAAEGDVVYILIAGSGGSYNYFNPK